jgi:hypothetical protein
VSTLPDLFISNALLLDRVGVHTCFARKAEGRGRKSGSAVAPDGDDATFAQFLKAAERACRKRKVSRKAPAEPPPAC